MLCVLLWSDARPTGRLRCWQVKCRQPKTGKQKVLHYYKDNPLYPSRIISVFIYNGTRYTGSPICHALKLLYGVHSAVGANQPAVSQKILGKTRKMYWEEERERGERGGGVEAYSVPVKHSSSSTRSIITPLICRHCRNQVSKIQSIVKPTCCKSIQWLCNVHCDVKSTWSIVTAMNCRHCWENKAHKWK